MQQGNLEENVTKKTKTKQKRTNKQKKTLWKKKKMREENKGCNQKDKVDNKWQLTSEGKITYLSKTNWGLPANKEEQTPQKLHLATSNAIATWNLLEIMKTCFFVLFAMKSKYLGFLLGKEGIPTLTTSEGISAWKCSSNYCKPAWFYS